MVILVTGAAGFIGRFLCEELLKRGDQVLGADNFLTGSKRNIAHLLKNPDFELIRHDIIHPLFVEADEIYNLACPASPVHYQANPVKTIKTSVMGTINMLGLAKRINAKILQASTSEVYGDPDVHPQPEDYWGRVNPIGQRSCYDEGKRVAESLMINYNKQNGVDIRIARIFNTYGPGMSHNDGRVLSNFIVSALKNRPVTIYGRGEQTRSFCFVTDIVRGLHNLMDKTDYHNPVNLGNTEEITILQLAQKVKEITGSRSEFIFKPLPQNDPSRRKPDIRLAEKLFGWKPEVDLNEGLRLFIEYVEKTL